MARIKRFASRNKTDVLPEKPTANTKKLPSQKRNDKSRSIHYRSSFYGIHEFLHWFEESEEKRKNDKSKVWFTEFQLEKLKQSPFYNVLKVFIYKKTKREEWFKNDNAILELVKRYRYEKTTREHTFVFQDSEGKPVVVKSTAEELAMFFGMKMVYPESEESDWKKTASEKMCEPVIKRMIDAAKKKVQLQQGKDASKRTDFNQLRKVDIEGAILAIMKDPTKKKNEIERNAEDLVKLFGVYLCVTVFFTLGNGSLSRKKYEDYFDSLERMNKTCWPVLIHSYLMKNIQENVNQPLSVNGCVIYLLFLFAEHNTILSPKNSETPRLARWRMNEISKRIVSKSKEEAMNKMSGALVQAYLPEEQKLIEEYLRMKQANDPVTLKENLRKSEMREQVLKEWNDELQGKFNKLVNVISGRKRSMEEMRSEEKLPEKELHHKYLDSLYSILNSNTGITDEEIIVESGNGVVTNLSEEIIMSREQILDSMAVSVIEKLDFPGQLVASVAKEIVQKTIKDSTEGKLILSQEDRDKIIEDTVKYIKNYRNARMRSEEGKTEKKREKNKEGEKLKTEVAGKLSRTLPNIVQKQKAIDEICATGITRLGKKKEERMAKEKVQDEPGEKQKKPMLCQEDETKKISEKKRKKMNEGEMLKTVVAANCFSAAPMRVPKQKPVHENSTARVTRAGKKQEEGRAKEKVQNEELPNIPLKKQKNLLYCPATEEDKTEKITEKKRRKKMNEGEMLKTELSGKLSGTPKESARSIDRNFTTRETRAGKMKEEISAKEKAQGSRGGK